MKIREISRKICHEQRAIHDSNHFAFKALIITRIRMIG